MKQTKHKLVEVNELKDIPENLKNTPINDLIKYHNFHDSSPCKEKSLIIITCMDYRVNLKIPDKFAYIIRTAGANTNKLEFKLAYASGMAGINNVAIIGHSDCGMVNLKSKEKKVIDGMIKNLSWTKEKAEKHFNESVDIFGINDEADFVKNECMRLKNEFPTTQFIPMVYKVEDDRLYLVE